MRCPYCHNPELVNSTEKLETIEWDEIYAFLQKRKNVLGGVCITGGEPLLYDGLEEIIIRIHSLGLKVKIDTNGTLPETLKRLDVDYIAMDIKTVFSKYYKCLYNGDSNILIQSIEYIINSGIEHEFRTTVVPGIITKEDISEIVNYLAGAKKYTLHQFRNNETLDISYTDVRPYPFDVLEKMKFIIECSGIPCEII